MKQRIICHDGTCHDATDTTHRDSRRLADEIEYDLLKEKLGNMGYFI